MYLSESNTQDVRSKWFKVNDKSWVIGKFQPMWIKWTRRQIKVPQRRLKKHLKLQWLLDIEFVLYRLKIENKEKSLIFQCTW